MCAHLWTYNSVMTIGCDELYRVRRRKRFITVQKHALPVRLQEQEYFK